MADVLGAGYHDRQGSNMETLTMAMSSRAPRIEMMPNPDFSFPMLPQSSAPRRVPGQQTQANRRPLSMHSNAPPAQTTSLAHRRAASTLPSFSFNAADTSGLQNMESFTPPITPDESTPATPSRRGHKRGGSEFVGGDSRLGVDGAISSSPTKANALPLPVPSSSLPAGRRGHAHRRSAAMSSHDVSGIMQAPEESPRLSSSLPNTPLEHPGSAPVLDRSVSAPHVNADIADPFGPPLDNRETRPSSSSRPRVGFSDNVEFIPRPLSTISSETESSMSTVRGHSVNNSISSMLSMGSPSPPSMRNPRTSLSTTFEDETKPRARSSLEISRRIEKEGEWLKRPTSSPVMKRPLSEPTACAPDLRFSVSELPTKARAPHNKKHSLSHALGLDRRRSEPVISLKAEEAARLSAISLQKEANEDRLQIPRTLERKSSTKRIKDWALLRLSKKTKDSKRSPVEPEHLPSSRPHSAGETPVPGKVPVSQLPTAETDLDAVFSSADSSHPVDAISQPRFEVNTPTPSYVSSFHSRDSDDASPVLDLDAALGPFKTPTFAGHKQRRELHSSRLTKDFGGPGLHYHRRAESAPELPPFSRGSTVSQSSLPDVFEGDGEEEGDVALSGRPQSSTSAQQEDATGVGIQIVDADMAASDLPTPWSVNHGLRIQQGDWELERPTTSHGNVSSMLGGFSIDRRPSSIVEETIMEEASPVEAVDIVKSHEEPRASSLTKSSDSSETPTLLASQGGMLALPDGQQSIMTPETYQTSAFSSPDFSRRQGSFDTSRVGTSASSVTDNRTMSSCTGDHSHDLRVSVDDVPSLTSSRSTMLSTLHANSSRRDFGSGDRTPSMMSGTLEHSAKPDQVVAAERRRKRASIQSLSQLVGGSFSGRSKSDESRPHTAVDSVTATAPKKKKEHRLKKLMFWRTKSKQSLRSDA